VAATARFACFTDVSLQPLVVAQSAYTVWILVFIFAISLSFTPKYGFREVRASIS
jgi:hypothetical protein